jgi:hypothetical protein
LSSGGGSGSSRNALGGSYDGREGGSWNPYGEGIPFAQAPYLPCPPKLEDEQLQWHQQLQGGKRHEITNSTPSAAAVTVDEDLSFLYSPSPSPRAHKHNPPKAFPVAGAVADSKFRK